MVILVKVNMDHQQIKAGIRVHQIIKTACQEAMVVQLETEEQEEMVAKDSLEAR